MKILVIYPEYKDAVTGGEMYDHHLIDRMSNSNACAVDFLTDDMLCSNNKYFYNLAYLRKFFFAKKYDVVLTNSRLHTRLFLLFLVLSLFSKTKLVSIHHHFCFLGENGIKKKLHKILELSFLKLSYVTIIPSPYIKQLFEVFLPNKKISYIELGIRNSMLHNQESEKTTTNLLYVGTVERRKGLIYLIESLDLLNKRGIQFHCDIVGKIIDEYYFLELKNNIDKSNLQDKIIFRGRVGDFELSEYYGKATCFVFPSLLEGYGMVILEAMSYGLPVIAFNNSAMPFTVKNNENGLLVQNESVKDFENAIYTVMTDDLFRKQLSQGALKTYSRFRTFKDMDTDIDLLLGSKFEIYR